MTHSLGAILLAAGQSTRMGGGDKLTIPVNKTPLIKHSLITLAALELRQVVVVIRGDIESLVKPILAPFGFKTVLNNAASAGMGTSLAEGARALESDLSGAFVCLADMPFVSVDTFRRLAQTISAPTHDNAAAVRPRYRGQHGHPVLFSSRLFSDLEACTGDIGAQRVLNAYAHQVHICDIDDRGVTFDIDTLDDLSRAERFYNPEPGGPDAN